jgi:hypothetical protein
MTEYKIGIKKVSVHPNGQIFVDGKNTKIKQWQCGNRYSNMSGQELKQLKGMSLEKALKFKGFLPR